MLTPLYGGLSDQGLPYIIGAHPHGLFLNSHTKLSVPQFKPTKNLHLYRTRQTAIIVIT